MKEDFEILNCVAYGMKKINQNPGYNWPLNTGNNEQVNFDPFR